MTIKSYDVTALILCGGEGTRIQSVLGDMPKCLAPVGGKPFLSYLIDDLHQQGIWEFVCCARSKDKPYWEKHRKTAFGKNRKKFSVNMMYEVVPKGTGYSLQLANRTLVHTAMTLVLNGDTYCPFNLAELLTFYEGISINRKTGLALLSDLNSVSTGISFQCSDVLLTLTEEEKKDFRIRQSKGLTLACRDFLDIGTPEGYAKAEAYLKSIGVIHERKTDGTRTPDHGTSSPSVE